MATAELWTTEMSSPRYLQACRRLDWRFLLPNPTLRNVLLVGPDNSSLANALRLFSESLALSSSASTELLVGHFELAVLVPPIRTVAFSSAIRSVAPGGCAYVECTGRFGKALYAMTRARRLLRTAGFGDIKMFWHRPSFEGCREIIPLDAAALGYSFSRERAGFRASLKMAAGRCVHALGLVPYAVGSISLVGTKR